MAQIHNIYAYAKHNSLHDILDTYMEFRTSSYLKEKSLPIPEGSIQKLITIPDRIYLVGDARIRILSFISHILHMTGSDTPSVQRFYYSLLPLWRYEFQELTQEQLKKPAILRTDKVFGLGTLGSPIASLGENGNRFLPFLKGRLAKLQEDFGPQIFKPNIVEPPQWFGEASLVALRYRSPKEAWKYILRITEKYLYIIDSIETRKGRSTKYRFSF